MGLYDRDYTRESSEAGFRYSPQTGLSFPSLTTGVKFLLIANISVYLIGILFTPLKAPLDAWFQLDATSLKNALQLWRLITYQFLHGSFMHILLNMIGLYFLGPTLERYWGTKTFLPFYLGCGIAGAIFYLFLVAIHFLYPNHMVGASGAILGVLAACAILFPNFAVFFYFFPVPIRIAAIGMIIWYLVEIIRKADNAGGDAAHVAGMAAGAIYVWSQPYRSQLKMKLRASRWQKKIASHYQLQTDVDRILQKVHDSGLHSLTSKEKRTLKKATKFEQIRKGYQP